jgi:uncharacterized protein YbjT (DUF2867 family)
MTTRTILITGATGQQGGAVLRALAGQGFTLRAMTRKPEGEPAKALQKLGAEIVRGDLDDADSLRAALRGAWGTFAVQNTWEAGVEREEEQGKRFATLAREAGVQHFVYSSVGSAHRQTGIPHFDNKWRIEETVRGLGFASHVIIRPVFFMENLVSPWFLQGDKIVSAMKTTTKLQMIAVDDIGKIGARAFTDTAMIGQAIDIAGDEVDFAEVTRVLGEAMGKRLELVSIPIEEVRKNSLDFALMLEWFERVGYDVDIAGIEERFGMKMLRLEAWARRFTTHRPTKKRTSSRRTAGSP